MVVLVVLLFALGALVVGLLTSSVIWLVVSIVACLIAIGIAVLSRGDGDKEDFDDEDETSPAQQPRRETPALTRPAQHQPPRNVPPAQPVPPRQPPRRVPPTDSQPPIRAGVVAPPNASRMAESGHPPTRSMAPPNPAVAAETKVVAAAPVALQRVWVIDGRPRYHRPECAIVSAADAEEIPRTQAVEDGFIPCALCDPDATLH